MHYIIKIIPVNAFEKIPYVKKEEEIKKTQQNQIKDIDELKVKGEETYLEYQISLVLLPENFKKYLKIYFSVLQKACNAISNFIENNDDLHVSFAFFDVFKQYSDINIDNVFHQNQQSLSFVHFNIY